MRYQIKGLFALRGQPQVVANGSEKRYMHKRASDWEVTE